MTNHLVSQIWGKTESSKPSLMLDPLIFISMEILWKLIKVQLFNNGEWV